MHLGPLSVNFYFARYVRFKTLAMYVREIPRHPYDVIFKASFRHYFDILLYNKPYKF